MGGEALAGTGLIDWFRGGANGISAMKIAGVPVQVLGALALVVAVVWVFVWPQRDVDGLAYLMLRWGHALVWLLLAVAAFLAPVTATAAKGAAIAAGVVYLAFLVTITLTR